MRKWWQVTFGDSAYPKDVGYVSIHRVTVLKDLTVAFLDPNIRNCTLKMEFINEKAIDDSGVSRNVYSAFWEQFLERCEGEEGHVPRLRSDLSEGDLQGVGRIGAKGFLDHGVMPVRLSKSFIFASVCEIDTIDVDFLM